MIFSKYMLETLGSSGEKFAPMLFVCLFVFNLQINTNLAKLLCPCSSAGSVQSQLQKSRRNTRGKDFRNTLKKKKNSAGQMLAISSMQRHQSKRESWAARWSQWLLRLVEEKVLLDSGTHSYFMVLI